LSATTTLAEGLVDLLVGPVPRDDVHRMRRVELFVLSDGIIERQVDLRLDLQRVQVCDEILRRLLVRFRLHRLDDLPLGGHAGVGRRAGWVGHLVQDDLGLVAVGEADLVDIIRRRDCREVGLGEGRLAERVVLLRLLVDEQREPAEDHDTPDDELVP
jgi:hypothetical protein